MSDQARMTPDLEKLESELRRLSLPSSVNRDNVLYQAGWAAASASFEQVNSPLILKQGSSQNNRWIWPLTSGGLATVAAVLGVLLVIQTVKENRSSVAEIAVATNEQHETGELEKTNSSTNRQMVDAPSTIEVFDTPAQDALSRPFDWPSGYPIAANLALRISHSPVRKVYKSVSSTDIQASNRHKSHHEMMDDLLQNEPRNTTGRGWPGWRLRLKSKSS